MADYYPLIARAVSGLDKNTGENRRALYDRARVALVNQLRGVQRAPGESDITRAPLALEEAIRKVEAETAKRVRADTPEPEEPSLRDRGLRDFRETVAEAAGLGRGAAAGAGARGGRSAEANRAAHATYEAMPVEAPRIEPHISTEPAPVTEPTLTDEAPPATPRAAPSSRPAYDDDDIYTRPARSYVGLIKVAVILLVVTGIAGGVYWQRHTIGT